VIRRGLAVLALGATPALADARTTLGVFDQWGAFSESAPQRCFALAEPLRAGGASRWRPFASIASWPGRGVRNQVHIRLSRARNPQARVTLSIGDRRFDLTATAADAWAPDARTDAAIVSAIRASRSMSVETLGHAGGPFADVYTLKGAATAIDAAALACVGG
jgi:hypothetical protein